MCPKDHPQQRLGLPRSVDPLGSCKERHASERREDAEFDAPRPVATNCHSPRTRIDVEPAIACERCG